MGILKAIAHMETVNMQGNKPTTTNLTAGLANYWSKEFMVRATGDAKINEWLSSSVYKTLWAKAAAMLPPSGKYDRRTKAYKYMKWHEPRERSKWEKSL